MADFGWSREERDAIVRPYHECAAALDSASLQLPAAPAGRKADLADGITTLQARLVELAQLYRARLPDATLGRCPFTSQPTVLSFDPFGLDGLFWDHELPTRAREEPGAGPHFIGLSGALRFVGPPEMTHFLVAPGPGVPVVVRRVIEQPGVRAALSAVRVGAHIGYAVAYYASDPDEAPERPKLWGTDVTSLAFDHDPEDDEPEAEDDFDYDLAVWIDRGRLTWIAPGDPEFHLRLGPEGCPFLGLQGEHAIQYMQDGKVWT